MNSQMFTYQYRKEQKNCFVHNYINFVKKMLFHIAFKEKKH